MNFLFQTVSFIDFIALFFVIFAPTVAIYLKAYFPHHINFDISRLAGFITFGIFFFASVSGCAASGTYFQLRFGGSYPSAELLVDILDHIGASLLFLVIASLPSLYSMHSGFVALGRRANRYSRVESFTQSLKDWFVFALYFFPGVIISLVLLQSNFIELLFGPGTSPSKGDIFNANSIYNPGTNIRISLLFHRLLESIEKNTSFWVLMIFISTILAIISRLRELVGKGIPDDQHTDDTEKLYLEDEGTFPPLDQ